MPSRVAVGGGGRGRAADRGISGAVRRRVAVSQIKMV